MDDRVVRLAKSSGCLVRVQGPDPKGRKLLRFDFFQSSNGTTAVSASGIVLPGRLSDLGPQLDGHVVGAGGLVAGAESNGRSGWDRHGEMMAEKGAMGEGEEGKMSGWDREEGSRCGWNEEEVTVLVPGRIVRSFVMQQQQPSNYHTLQQQQAFKYQSAQQRWPFQQQQRQQQQQQQQQQRNPSAPPLLPGTRINITFEVNLPAITSSLASLQSANTSPLILPSLSPPLPLPLTPLFLIPNPVGHLAPCVFPAQPPPSPQAAESTPNALEIAVLRVSSPSTSSANDTLTPGSPVLLLGSPFGVLAPTLFANSLSSRVLSAVLPGGILALNLCLSLSPCPLTFLLP
ncbi:unnamed protein product [Closterium sp. Naga37s-1]|nr:unnamed protein product [Closterium sp. Naga37s-1]